MTLGGRVAVLRDGKVEQVAPPMELYRRPATVFVGGFVGSPAMNFLPGDIMGRTDGSTLGIRPHDVVLVPPGQGDLDAKVDVVEPRGSELLVHLRLDGLGSERELRVVAPPEPMVPADTVTGVRFDRERLHWFDRQGRRVE